MFATRVVQRVQCAVQSSLRRIHSQTNSAAAKNSNSLRYAALVGCSAVVVVVGGAALQVRNAPGTVECQPTASQAVGATSSMDGNEPVNYYRQTGSRLPQLPKTPEEIAKVSFDDLAVIYDPAQNTTLQPIAHGLVWGTPPPPPGLEPIELLFTKEDTDPMHRHMELLVRTIQDRICNDLLDVEQLGGTTLDTIDGVALTPELRKMLLCQTETAGKFREDITIRPGGTGGGVTRILQGGRVFAKAGVSVSVANVKPPPQALQRLMGDHPRLRDHAPKEPYTQWTAAVSLVLHPVSPNVPTVHANYRIFDLTMPDGKRVWWFGGGSDLTPSCVVDEDAKHFHCQIKKSLDQFDPTYYPKWKKWADEYFYIKHRDETRGVGGVFFDDLHSESQEHYESVVRRLGESFSAQYFPIVMKRKDQKFTGNDLLFQQLRRGRYVEFNLVYDKGTTYGLNMINARPDGVLMSLPPITRFQYKQPFETKEQQYTKQILTKPKDWC